MSVAYVRKGAIIPAMYDANIGWRELRRWLHFDIRFQRQLSFAREFLADTIVELAMQKAREDDKAMVRALLPVFVKESAPLDPRARRDAADDALWRIAPAGRPQAPENRGKAPASHRSKRPPSQTPIA